ncbi:hypothetical protein ACIGDI_11350 [Streptomyces sp. NPDC085900]|uniref:hypothetical protein n=1 Tax=Streptomyces sp. NPDC085900 TaxID=3365737 RepID=UPI0037D3FE12
MPGRKYTEKEKQDYLELASEIGHSRAMRELGYPKHWNTANTWAKEHGVTIALDELKQKAAAFNDWYQTEDLLITMQEAIARGREFILEDRDLNADGFKKTVEGMKRAIETMQLLQGKATSRNGTEKDQDQADPFAEALDAFLAAEQSQDAPSHQDSPERA